MAFSIRRLSVLAYANGFTLWHYKTGGEEPSETLQTGYFDDAADMLAAGDLMMVSGAASARMLAVAHASFGEPVAIAPLC
jgi:hypothetical protein